MVAEGPSYNSPSGDYMGDTDPDWIDEGTDPGDPGIRAPVVRDFIGQKLSLAEAPVKAPDTPPGVTHFVQEGIEFAGTAAEAPVAEPDTPPGVIMPKVGEFIEKGMESAATAARGPVAEPILPPRAPPPRIGDISDFKGEGIGSVATAAKGPIAAPFAPPGGLSPKIEGFFDRLNADDVKPVVLSFLVITVTLLLVFVSRVLWKRKKRDTILLVGLSGGGKTALFYQLRDGSTHRGTVTSMEPNEDRFILYSEAGQPNAKKLSPIHMVDVPGHPRLKPKIDEYLPQAAGITFVVDALDFMPQVRTTAEYLYDVLAKELVVRRKIPILLACNKMDKVTAHSVDFIKRQLEKEIDKLRSTRRAVSDADEESGVLIGSADVAFTFDQCVNKVTLCESSAMVGNVEFVEQFVREKVKA